MLGRPSEILRSKLIWAIIAELLILLVCLIIRPDFFSISYQPSNGMLYGSLIDILNRSAEITIVAMGMTLVIATGGTDLSVGSLVAVSGALALRFMRWDWSSTPRRATGPSRRLPGYLAVLLVCLLMGAFNGLLISRWACSPSSRR